MRYVLLLLVLLACAPLDSRAEGGASIPPCTATAPAQATAVGFTNLTFCDTLSTQQSIDINNTKVAGFKWYIQNYSEHSVFAPLSFLLNDGTGFWLAGQVGGKSTVLNTAVQVGTSQAYIGQVFSGGFYAEATRKLSPTSTTGEPSFWFQDIKTLLNYSSPPDRYTEIDVFDWPAGNGPDTSIFDWAPGEEATTGYGNTNNHPSMGSPTYSNYNTYGVLVVPSTQNAGTGYVKWYFNNTLVTTVTYSPTGVPNPSTCTNPYTGSVTCPSGTYSNLDTENAMMMFGTDNGGAGGAALMEHTVKDVHVWQLPGAR